MVTAGEGECPQSGIDRVLRAVHSREVGFRDTRIKQHSLEKQCVGNICGVVNSCKEYREKRKLRKFEKKIQFSETCGIVNIGFSSLLYCWE